MRTAVAALAVLALLWPAPAHADYGRRPGPPPVATQPQQAEAQPVAQPTRTCRMYASSVGFGMLCSDRGGAGPTLAEVLQAVGITPSKPFCWDEALPEGVRPPTEQEWALQTCLSFDGGIVSGGTARLSYTPVQKSRAQWEELREPQKTPVENITGRGQIPFLLPQTSPVTSPRVGQPVSFYLACDSRKVLCDSAGGIRTPRLTVGPGGVEMWAELVHTRVLPEGTAQPERDCRGAGLRLTAEELDRRPVDDPSVCRYAYPRSSNDRGPQTQRDRWPARATAYWQVWFDDGSGPQRLGLPYAKSATYGVRVTEVQSLVVG